MLDFILVFSETYGLDPDMLLLVWVFAFCSFLAGLGASVNFCLDAGSVLYRVIKKCVRAIRFKLSGVHK